ncbi:MAG TPA: hypothetical protein ENF81_05860 [Thermotogaceae bacterium]|nr:hypothetical protein [Thermotogaceae bacterium]
MILENQLKIVLGVSVDYPSYEINILYGEHNSVVVEGLIVAKYKSPYFGIVYTKAEEMANTYVADSVMEDILNVIKNFDIAGGYIEIFHEGESIYKESWSGDIPGYVIDEVTYIIENYTPQEVEDDVDM